MSKTKGKKREKKWGRNPWTDIRILIVQYSSVNKKKGEAMYMETLLHDKAGKATALKRFFHI